MEESQVTDQRRTEPSGGVHPLPGNRIYTYFIIALVGAAADLLTKQWIFQWRGLPGEQAPWWLVEDVVGIETAVNIGAVFGIGAGMGPVFAAFSIVAGIAILVWLFGFGAARSWWLCIALAMVTGGIIGNLYDRLGLWWDDSLPTQWKSGVRDWILMQAGESYKWPNYNIADSLLVIGAGMLVWKSFFPDPPVEDSSPGETSRRQATAKPHNPKTS